MSVKEIAERVEASLGLSEAQRVVLKYTLGLGVEPLNGAEIAARFGELAGEGPILKRGKRIYRSVSKPRITQHRQSIVTKFKKLARNQVISNADLEQITAWFDNRAWRTRMRELSEENTRLLTRR